MVWALWAYPSRRDRLHLFPGRPGTVGVVPVISHHRRPRACALGGSQAGAGTDYRASVWTAGFAMNSTQLKSDVGVDPGYSWPETSPGARRCSARGNCAVSSRTTRHTASFGCDFGSQPVYVGPVTERAFSASGAIYSPGKHGGSPTDKQPYFCDDDHIRDGENRTTGWLFDDGWRTIANINGTDTLCLHAYRLQDERCCLGVDHCVGSLHSDASWAGRNEMGRHNLLPMNWPFCVGPAMMGIYMGLRYWRDEVVESERRMWVLP